MLKDWRALGAANASDAREGRFWAADWQWLSTVAFTSALDGEWWQDAAGAAPGTERTNAQNAGFYRTESNDFATGVSFAGGQKLGVDARDAKALSDVFGVVRAAQDTPGEGNGLSRFGTVGNDLPSNAWIDVTFDSAGSAGNTAPAMTSGAAFSLPETASIIGTITAVDLVSDAIAGGPDAFRAITIPTNSLLSPEPAPGFEAPFDLKGTLGDTANEAIVSAADTVAAPIEQTILVTVTDDQAPGGGGSLPAAAVATGASSDPNASEPGLRLTADEGGAATLQSIGAANTMASRIVAENARLDGVADKSYWDVAHSRHIEGFATDISVNAGGRVDFKINVNADTFGGAGSDYKIEIFRLGYYGGAGAREVAELANANATVQPDPLVDRTRGLVDAGNWSVTDSWDVPADAVSGVYLARLQRVDASGNPIEGAVNQIPFVIRNDGVPADIVLQTSDTTWHAYNGWGGNNGQLGANFYGDAGDVADARFDLEDPGPFGQDRAYAVSYNRPFITRGIEDNPTSGGPAAGPQDYLFGADYAAIHWLEKNGYDVTYMSGVDTDRLGTSWFENEAGERIRDAFISVGHDEYWSGQQRGAVEAARADGVNLLFWSGNEVYWKTRWEVSISPDGTEYRTLVCYKETWANGDPNAGPEDYANLDPSNVWTGTWRDDRFSTNPLAGANDGLVTDPLSGLLPYCNCAENHLTGQSFGPDGTGEFGAAIDVAAPFAALRVWRDTTVAQGGALDIAPGILGYEWNTSPEDDKRPEGLIKLSDTTAPWSGILVDQGNRTQPGEATHNLSLYRDESGALVFGAGTVFWTWALSDLHDNWPYGAQIENRDLQQFTINMFADMGIFPAVDPVIDAILASQGLIRATGSTDFVAATATIADLPDQVAALQAVLITGTATDDDGNAATADGRVAVVEVSVDGGLSWRVAETTDAWATWSYLWRPAAEGEYRVLARAIDDSLNIRNATPDQEIVTVTAPVMPDTFSVFGGLPVLGAVASNDGTPVELGMKFSVDRAGAITGLKYWRAASDANDTDLREGRLWGPDGQLLATVTFTSAPGASGWQTAALSAPVAVLANTQYVVSYHTENNYVATSGFFAGGNEVAFDGRDDNAFGDYFGVIRAPQDAAGAANGVYRYGNAGSALPTDTFQASNYWVDVTFDPADTSGNGPPVITSAATFSLAENTSVVGTITATDPDGNAIVYAIAGGADASRFVINPTTGLLSFVSAPNFEAPVDLGGTPGDNVYEVVVSATDNISAAVTQAVLVSVTDVEEPDGAISLFGGAAATGASNDANDYELGVRFTANVSGSVTQLQYFRTAQDSGDVDLRTLTLWTSDGTKLASVNVGSEVGAVGWQVGTLAAPVALAAGGSYIVSYGYNYDGVADAYAYTLGGLSAPVSSAGGALTAPASGQPTGLSGGGIGNGLFNETLGLLPQQSFNAANYWVDVTFDPADTSGNGPPVITSAATFSLAENTSVVGTITATDPDGNAIVYAIVGGADASRFVINPTTGLLSFVSAPNFEAPVDLGGTPGDNVYEVVVSATDNISAAVTQAVLVSVTDVEEPDGAISLFGGAAATGASNDANDYELGVRFTANVSGSVTQLQYFRTAQDSGDVDLRTLTLWTSDGTKLASVNVGSEVGAVGWQVGTLAAPVALAAGGSYIVSYGYNYDGVADAYAYTLGGLSAPVSSAGGALTAPASGQPTGLSGGGIGNGLFNETLGLLPQQSFNAANYWVDVGFAPTVVQNTAPTVTPIVLSTNEDAPVLGIDLLAAAQDPDGDALGLTLQDVVASDGRVVVFSLAATGVVSLDPNQFNDLKAGQNVTVTVAYAVGDGVNAAVSTTATLEVAGRNDAPIAAPDVATTTEAATVSGNVLTGAGADSDPDGDVLTVTAVNGGGLSGPIILASGARVTMSASGDFVYDPNGAFDALLTGQSATDSFTYVVSDGVAEATAVATVTIEGIGVSGLSLVGNNSNNLLNGGDGDDTLSGLGGRDTLNGGGGNDTLFGGTGNDVMNGGEGDDLFIVAGIEGQADTISGGAGINTLRVEAAGGAPTLTRTTLFSDITVFEGSGQAVRGTSAADVLDFSVFATVTGVSAIEGLGGRDLIVGTSGNDVIDGGSGNDTLIGGEGDDLFVVRGVEAQADTIEGGAGVNTVRVDAAAGALTLTNTTLMSEVSVFDGSGQIVRGTTGSNVLDFSVFGTVTGVAAIEGLGGSDRVIGTSGNDVIDGGSGRDTLNGGGGDDTMTGGTDADTFLFRAGIATGDTLILDFDAAGNDIIRFEGYSFGAADPSTLSTQARRDAVRNATTFADGDALIDLAALGDAGTIRLAGVAALTFTSTEDFVFG